MKRKGSAFFGFWWLIMIPLGLMHRPHEAIWIPIAQGFMAVAYGTMFWWSGLPLRSTDTVWPWWNNR